MNVFVIGKGASAAAMMWKLRQSPHVSDIRCAPYIGNAHEYGAVNTAIDPLYTGLLADYAERSRMDLTVVCHENSLAAGVTDEFLKRGLAIAAPTKAAAEIELSKALMHEIAHQTGIPMARHRVFEPYQYSEALTYVAGTDRCVIKDDGPAAGKGVDRCQTVAQARASLRQKLFIDRKRVVVEEWLDGEERSIHAIVDRKSSYHGCPIMQDYKRLGEDNTGGMGCYGRASTFGMPTYAIDTMFIDPILQWLKEHRTPFAGCIYPGLIFTPEGPKLLECNARFGDPEWPAILRLLQSDLALLLNAVAHDTLAYVESDWSSDYVVNVVMASAGYPGNSVIGHPITGLEAAREVEGVQIFHAGTQYEGNSRYYTCGGRVLDVTAVGMTLAEARERAYVAVRLIYFEGMQFREDIAANL